jgi:hypothetical protein
MAALVAKQPSEVQGKVLASKLVLKIKRDKKGNIERYKARLEAKGFRQVAGRDYDEVFAPTAQQTTLWLLLSHAVENDLEIRQFDVSSAFLNGDLAETAYLKLPEALGGKIWKLQKALYGLKQAAGAWYVKLRSVMQGLGYYASPVDPCLFARGVNKEQIVIGIHVDDGIGAGPVGRMEGAIKEIRQVLKLKDLGRAKLYLGMELLKHPVAKGCTDDGTLAIVPIYIPILD